jgi:thymidylate synthase (methanogen type)
MGIEWPVEHKRELLLGDLNKSVALCTLWSEKEFVAGQVGLQNVMLLGNLYSHAPGVEAIVRNVLANPAIRTIVVAGKDKTRSAETLNEFFRTGVTQNDFGLLIRKPDDISSEELPVGKRTIDSAIPTEEIARLRANVELIDLRGQSWDTVKNRILSVGYKLPFAEGKVFPKTESKIEILSGEKIGWIFRGDDCQEVWLEILRTIRKFGITTGSDYSTKTQEVSNVMTVINGSLDNIAPHIIEYSKQLIHPSDIEGGDTYNYGYRMRKHNGDQIAKVITILKENPHSRRIFVDLWDVKKDLFGNNQNPPCMTQVVFRFLDNKLTATFNYRSHDMVGAWIMNALGDRLLQAYIATESGIQLGETTIISNSAHIYENVFSEVDLLLRSNQRRWEFTEDPRGNFIITTENDEIVVRHENNSGAINILTGSSAESLYKEIWKRGLISLVDHSLYIGYVLSKAESAVRNGEPFDQDKA